MEIINRKLSRPWVNYWHSFCLAILASSSSWGQTVTWGTPLSTNAAGGNRGFLSDGSPMPNGFQFEIGYWNMGYDPEVDPTSWATNWNRWDPDNPTYRTSPPFPFYGFTASETNTNPALNNKQLYIWAFNDKSLMGLTGGEALLLSSPLWRILDSATPLAETYTTSTTTQVLWGRVDPDTTGTAAALITGDGNISAPRAANTFHLQTAGFGIAPIPEPGPVSLLAASVVSIFRRRRCRH